MVKQKKYVFSFIILSIISLYCTKESDNKKLTEECNSMKIDLLLRDVFKKRHLFNMVVPSEGIDSSARYNYVSSQNFVIPNNDYYIQAVIIGAPVEFDSVKLKIVDNFNKKDANKLGITLKETNKDTTDIKLSVGYGSYNNVALNNTTFHYIFKADSCKWIVKDSTFWEY